MRTAPPIGITSRRFGAWNAAIVGLGLAGVASVLAWGWFRPDPLGRAGWLAVAAGVPAIAFGLVRPMWRTEPFALLWDGRGWLLGPSVDRLTAGDLGVALDFGAWLLLRFTADGGVERRRRTVHWLPVQRAGLEPQWHAFRCAVYGPMPPAGLGNPR